MANNGSFVGICVLGILTASLVLFLPVHGTAWVGNDDGEFDGGVGAPTPSYVFVQESFSTGLAWSSSPPNNLVSLQYNPDWWTSYSYQTYGDWFQTGIINYGDCVRFTVQVYSLYTGTQVWANTYPSASCLSVNQLDEYSNSIWYIQESGMNSCCDPYVKNVYFSVMSQPSYSRSYTIYPPETWKWLRSNICWCGTDSGSATFTTAGGTSQMGSNQNLYAISPPITISTAENSNMPYGQFSGSGTLSMYQSFGWPPPPPPPPPRCPPIC